MGLLLFLNIWYGKKELKFLIMKKDELLLEGAVGFFIGIIIFIFLLLFVLCAYLDGATIKEIIKYTYFSGFMALCVACCHTWVGLRD